MPTFDITSEFNTQEITNAVDQAYREIVNRYDFRDTGTNIEFNEQTITLKSSTEERLKACLLYTSPSPRDQRGSGIASCG